MLMLPVERSQVLIVMTGPRVRLFAATRPFVASTAIIAIVVTLLLVARVGLTTEFPAYLYFVAVGVPMAAIDATTGKLPDRLTLPSYPILVILIGVAGAASPSKGAATRAAVAAALLVAVFFAAALLRGVGLGDVKLAGLLGLVLGFRSWTAVYVGMLVAFVLAALFIVFLSSSRRNCAHIPLGPFLVAGAMVAILL